jgi:hypothetical protein
VGGAAQRLLKMKNLLNRQSDALSALVDFERVAYLTLALREYRSGSQRALRYPIVHGTLVGSDWQVTMDNPFALGQMARLVGFDGIELTSTPYLAWGTRVERLRNAEIRATLEPWDAKFLAAVRDGFNATATRRMLRYPGVPSKPVALSGAT